MKELAKKEARGYWTVLFITILFVLFPWMAVLLQNQFSDFLRTVPGYEIKQASTLITGIGVWCHFWYPHNTGTSPSCCLSKGCFAVIDFSNVAMLDLWGFHSVSLGHLIQQRNFLLQEVAAGMLSLSFPRAGA
jgi:hypothetical protein